MSCVLEELGIPLSRGKKSGAEGLRLQTEKMLQMAAFVRFREAKGDRVHSRFMYVGPGLGGEVLQVEGNVLRETLRLNPLFVEDVQIHSIPVDLELFERWSRSAFTLDLFLFLSYRIRAVEGSVFLPWRSWGEQLGYSAGSSRRFKQRVASALEEIVRVWPFRVRLEKAGLRLYAGPSYPVGE